MDLVEEECQDGLGVEDYENWEQIWMGDEQSLDTPHKLSVAATTCSAVTNVKVTDNRTDTPKSSDQLSLSEVKPPATGDHMMSRMLLNDNKAGMEGLDKEKINKIIHEASKGSRFYKNEQKKDEQVKRRIEEQNSRLDCLTPEQICFGILESDKLIRELERERDMSHTIVHVDMDMFYAAVEMRDCPELKEKPMAVGGNSMLSTSNYIARKYGVRAAMPGFIGKKLCPNLVIVKPNFDKYKAVSGQVRDIFKDYDPNFAPMSLDEAYLDFTEYLKHRASQSDDKRTFASRSADHLCNCFQVSSRSKHDFYSNQRISNLPEEDSVRDGEKNSTVCPDCGKNRAEHLSWETFGLSVSEAVREMRFRIEHRTRLTASAGIAPNTMLAKVCSDKNKPNGQYEIPPVLEEVKAFVSELPIRKVSGIGKVSEQMLSALGVNMCPDILGKRGILYHLYSKIAYHHFIRIALGISSTTVERDSERKSMSVERTFSELSKPTELYEKCKELCVSLAEDLASEDLTGKTVTLKLKTVDFEVKTRACSMPFYTNSEEHIFSTASDVLRNEIKACHPRPLKLRLMGVRMSNFNVSHTSDPSQKTITALFKSSTNTIGVTHNASASEGKVPDESIDTSHRVINSSSLGPPRSPKKAKDKSGNILNFLKKECGGVKQSTDLPVPEEHSASTIKYICPICDKSIDCDTLGAFNKHIDMCLMGNESTRTPNQPTLNSERISFTKKSVSAALSSGSMDISKASLKANMYAENHDFGASYMCPVCSIEQKCSDLRKFNLHVDKCLGITITAGQSNTEHMKRKMNSETTVPLSKKRKTSDVKKNSGSIKKFFI